MSEQRDIQGIDASAPIDVPTSKADLRAAYVGLISRLRQLHAEAVENAKYQYHTANERPPHDMHTGVFDMARFIFETKAHLQRNEAAQLARLGYGLGWDAYHAVDAILADCQEGNCACERADPTE